MLSRMDLRRSLIVGMRRGMQSTMREGKWSMTFLCIFAATFLLQALLLTLLGAWTARATLLTKGSIPIEVRAGAQNADVQEFYAELRNQPFLFSAAFVPREQAFAAEAARDPALAAFLEKYQLDNPFPDTFAVTLLSLESFGALRSFVEDARWEAVVHPSFVTAMSAKEQQIRDLVRVSQVISLAVEFLLIVALVVLTLLIAELVRRRVERRKGEMRLEKLLGALPVDIMTPFFTEVFLFLFAAVALATFCVLFILAALPFVSPHGFGNALLAGFRSDLWRMTTSTGLLILVLEFLVLPAAAAGGVFFGMRSAWVMRRA